MPDEPVSETDPSPAFPTLPHSASSWVVLGKQERAAYVSHLLLGGRLFF